MTFDTVTVLPNIPGAVNDFLSGRTYPMAGSAMLLPQHAPYTDPIEIMICGGSTPAAIALDNCFTIAAACHPLPRFRAVTSRLGPESAASLTLDPVPLTKRYHVAEASLNRTAKNL